MTGITRAEFIEISSNIHNNFYDYSLVEYKNRKTSVIIKCPIHGNFEQTPEKHLLGRGCTPCGIKKRSNNARKDNTTYINELIKIHGEKYDYSLVEYFNNTTKVKLICPIHGIFKISPNNLRCGQGCAKCGKIRGGKIKQKSYNYYINKATIKHSGYYSYDVNLDDICPGRATIIKIICPKHGQFKQQIGNHLTGTGCPTCKGDLSRERQAYTHDEIISILNKCSKEYDYSQVVYKNMQTPVIIICPIHKEFKVRLYNYVYSGSRCPKCAYNGQGSKGEKEVLEYVKSIYSGIILENDRTIIKPKEIDILLPEINLAIEYNGTYWHKLHEIKTPGYHQMKKDLCKEKSYALHNIAEVDWVKNQQLTKDNLYKIIKKYDRRRF